MAGPFRQAFIGAGSNLGDRAALLRTAIEQLRSHPGITALECSPVYETDPVGLSDQPPFLNLVLGCETSLGPESLLAALRVIEDNLGRQRAVRWGPRTLDLDLLAFEGERRDTPQLTLPHPRLFERAFVTVPLQAVLAQPRFAGGCWDDLRRQLPEATALPAGVRLLSGVILHDD